MLSPTRYTALEKYRILQYAKNNGIITAAKKYKIDLSTIYRWKKQFDGTMESLKPKYCAPYKHPSAHTKEEIKNIKDVLENNPYISNKRLYQILKADYGYNRHPNSLYNYLRRNNISYKSPKKNDYATMFNAEFVSIVNKEFCQVNNFLLPQYLIELDGKGIYIASRINNNPCQLTLYYSTALKFDSIEKAREFLKSIKNASKIVLNIKEIKL